MLTIEELEIVYAKVKKQKKKSHISPWIIIVVYFRPLGWHHLCSPVFCVVTGLLIGLPIYFILNHLETYQHFINFTSIFCSEFLLLLSF